MGRPFQMSSERMLPRLEQVLDEIVHFSKTLDASRSFDETNEVLCQAVTGVERVVADFATWMQKGANGEQREKAAPKIRAALQSICNLRERVENLPKEKVPLVVRVLDVGDVLLCCHIATVQREEE